MLNPTELLRAVLSWVSHDGRSTARMVLHIVCHIIYAILNDDEQVVYFVVLGYFGDGPLLHAQREREQMTASDET